MCLFIITWYSGPGGMTRDLYDQLASLSALHIGAEFSFPFKTVIVCSVK